MFRDLWVRGHNIDEDCYKRYKNKLTTLLRNAERIYYKNKLETNKNNLTKLWRTLNEVISRKKHDNRSITFWHNNIDISDKYAIASLFNKYFLNAPKEIYKTIPSKCHDPCKYVNRSSGTLFMKPVTNDEIKKLLSSLRNTSAGHDDINPYAVKQVKDYLVEPLTYIYNLSLSSGIFPSKLKIAKVLPIYKKGDKSSVTNYRPVSVLPVFSKLFEKIVYNRIVEFIDKYNILSENQFGFRRNRSTHMAISALVEKFHTAVEDNKFMVGLFIDLSRAFDTISHDILLAKLSMYGIRGVTLDWIKSYLRNRKQYVSYRNAKSEMCNIEIGIPQG